MITTEALPERADMTHYYGSPESVMIPNSRALPTELADKIGQFDFERPYVAELRDVHLAGPALVAFYKGDVVLDVAYYGRYDVLQRNYPYFELATNAMNVKSEHLDTVFSAIGVWSNNYYHWTLDYLPMLEGLREYERITGREVEILIEPYAPAWKYDSLQAYGFNKTRVVDAIHYYVDRLIVVPSRRRKGRIAKGALEYLWNISDFSRNHTNRIYITRRKAQTRHIVNEDDLIKELIPLGFDAYTLEDLDWYQQVELFNDADMVVGPHGAGMVNIVYAAGTPKIVEIFTPAYINPCVFTIAGALEYPYRCVVGRAEKERKDRVRENIILRKKDIKQVLDYVV